MCGIAGIWASEPAREPLLAMAEAMVHRGPDDQGVFTNHQVGLTMRRLAVIDLSEAAHQPMSAAGGGLWIVYNGECYNFPALRQELEKQGHSFSSQSDTEVVLRLYQQHGDGFLTMLRGMFALAIYDRRQGPGRERLLLARDHLGIKPLLHAETPHGLVFASELKALLASGLVAPEIDPEALRLLLTMGSVYQPHTMLKGVSALPPGHKLVIDRQGRRLERYWSMAQDLSAQVAGLPYGEQVELVADALEQSLRMQLVSDVPIGAFLSGGVDSSYLVGLMAAAKGQRVKTFSVSFLAEGAHIDESPEAERTARLAGAEHTNVPITGGQVRDNLEHFIRALDQPSVDGLNSYFISWAARQAVTVAISGTGGDELFAGYPWFAQMMQFNQARQAGGLKRLWARLTGNGNSGAQEHGDFLTAYALTYQIFGPEGAAVMLAPELRAPAKAGRGLSQDLAPLDLLASGDPVQRTTALCLGGYTGNQLLRDIDAVSMAHSLEVRVPFLDAPLLSLALSLPPEAKIGRVAPSLDPVQATYRECGNKRILIDAGVKRGLLPPEIDCQPKRGFALPFDPWLRGPLREVMQDALSSRSVRQRGWLDPVQTDYVLSGFLEGKLSWAHPWLLMVIELWGRQVLDQS